MDSGSRLAYSRLGGSFYSCGQRIARALHAPWKYTLFSGMIGAVVALSDFVLIGPAARWMGLSVPTLVLFAGALLVGLVGNRRWLRFTFIFACGYGLVQAVRTVVIYSDLPARGFMFILEFYFEYVRVLPLAIFAAWIGSGPRVRRREDRVVSGLCVKCGYSLTDNISGRCPECGEETPPPELRRQLEQLSTEPIGRSDQSFSIRRTALLLFLVFFVLVPLGLFLFFLYCAKWGTML